MTFTISVFEIMLFYAALNIVIILLNVVDVVDVVMCLKFGQSKSNSFSRAILFID